MTVYDWKDISVKDITTMFLYGSFKKPDNLVDDKLIRQKVVTKDDVSVFEDGTALPAIKLDAVSFMSSGPGRFALGAQFPLVKAFLMLLQIQCLWHWLNGN